MANRTVFDALPGYLGGKRRLAPLILSEIAAQLPAGRWPMSTLQDPFCGGGAVALTAKAHGFTVVASDSGGVGFAVARALIANSQGRLSAGDIRGLGADPGIKDDGRLAAYVPSVFSVEQATWLTRAAVYADQRSDPVRALLQVLIARIALRCHPMSLPTATDAAAAVAGDYDRISPRRLGHYLRVPRHFAPDAVQRLAEQVNRGVFPGAGLASNLDALTALSSHRADVAYLDPPYAGTTGYADTYAALDALLGRTGPIPPVPSVDDLLEASRHVPLVVLSYGGPSVQLESLTARVEAHRPVRRALAIPYRHLPSLATQEKNRGNREFLILA